MTTQTTEFADEVVTRSLVRYVELPGLAGPIALITLENGRDHTRPSTFGPAGLSSLDNALDEIAAHSPTVSAIAVTGKPFIFAVGADLSGIPLVRTREEALQIGELGQRVFRRLYDSTIPTFAFVNGAAMGGGLELALHCQYRTLSTGVAAIALPEVSRTTRPAPSFIPQRATRPEVGAAICELIAAYHHPSIFSGWT